MRRAASPRANSPPTTTRWARSCCRTCAGGRCRWCARPTAWAASCSSRSTPEPRDTRRHLLDPALDPGPRAAAADRQQDRAHRRRADERHRAAHLERHLARHRPARPHDLRPRPRRGRGLAADPGGRAAGAHAARRTRPAVVSSRPAAARACTWWCRSAGSTAGTRSRASRRRGGAPGATIPDRFVAKSGPRNRVGKIFVDYLRNGFGATTVSAWSARSRPGLGVSVPVAGTNCPRSLSAAQWTSPTRPSASPPATSRGRRLERSRKGIAAPMKMLDYKPG
jgi:hypothetical protein